MAAWTSDELTRIGTADELRIAPRRRDGTLRPPTTIWVARDGDRLFVRSVRGRDATWFRGASATRAGRIEAGGVAKDVEFVEPGDGIADRLDAAYRDKYGRYPSGIVNPLFTPAARGATLELVPGPPTG